MFKYFSFNLDTRIHTSPKEGGCGSKELGPGGSGEGWAGGDPAGDPYGHTLHLVSVGLPWWRGGLTCGEAR